MNGLIFNIQRFSVHDGPGIRTTVFFKGCNLSCEWCHNPESQSGKIQMMFHREKCISCGKCKEKCPNNLEKCDFCGECALYCPQDAREICGKEYSVEQVMDEALRDIEFYSNSGGGITFSGGECMLQIDFLEKLLCACRSSSISTAVDTAGHLPFEYFERVIPYTDLFLYDLKCADGDKHRRYTGVDNELILENLGKLLALGKRVWIRIPIIPTVNDTEDEMRRIKDIISRLGEPEKIELLPYHALGEHKYSAIGKRPKSFTVPSEELMKSLRAVLNTK